MADVGVVWVWLTIFLYKYWQLNTSHAVNRQFFWMVKGRDLGFALGMTHTGVTWFHHKSLRLRLGSVWIQKLMVRNC